MSTGAYISGVLHLGLILWILLGGVLFRGDPPKAVATSQVALLSEADFAALAARPEPLTAQDVSTPSAPELSDAPQISPGSAAPAAPAPRPDITPPADPEAVPDRPDLTTPQAEVADQAPEVPTAPDLTQELAALPPGLAPAPPRAAPRVAPLPAPQAPRPADNAPELSPGVTILPDAPERPVEEEAPATAPEAATTEIVTEADETESTAPAASARPRPRPAPEPERVETASADPAPAPDPEPREAPAAQPPEPDQPSGTSDPLADAIAGAVASAVQAPPAPPSGPPLSGAEKDALRVAVQQCWNVGSLSTEALNTTVVVGVAMAPDGRPDVGSIRMLSATGGTGTAVRQAFEAARRAIIRCGARGFDLPAEKYAQWQSIEMTFNPERMRIK